MYNPEQLINAALKFLEKRFDLLGFKITTALEKLSSNIKGTQETQNRILNTMAAQFEQATKRIEKPKVIVEVDTDAIAKAVNKLSSEVTTILGRDTSLNLEPLLNEIKAVRMTLNENKPKDFPIDALDVVFKGLKPKESVRFDDTQMKGLMAALTNRGTSVSGDVMAARSASVFNVAMAAANTEYSFTFPANTVAYELRLRATDYPVLVALSTGKLPTSGDGLAYFTVPSYFIEKTPGLDWSGKKIYLQTETTSQVVEVICYTA